MGQRLNESSSKRATAAAAAAAAGSGKAAAADDDGGASSSASFAKKAQRGSATSQTEASQMKQFLASAKLEKFASGFVQFGISSVQDLCDPQLISDAELISELKMTKVRGG